MQRAIDETERRRQKQLAFNREHGIEPRGIKKKVTDILESGPMGLRKKGKGKRGKADAAALEQPDTSHMGAAQLAKLLKQLEATMQQHARDLEFEQAATVRDEIHRLREQVFLRQA
jgi:excinuclease ABC subunit B